MPSFGNNAIYEQRRTNYINTALAASTDAVVLQAYTHIPVDSAGLAAMLVGIETKTTVDFDVVKLIRVLELTNGQYDSVILDGLYKLPFWLTKGDTIRGYWSENHMIQWMSSDWLLHEKYNKPVDANLDYRLRHYLKMKVKYGFYEFFSSVYSPYSLSGLLNLADFSQDVEIKTLATLAAERLLKDILRLTNDKGVFFPIAGRNYYGKYASAYGQNHSNLIYLLTGMGDAPTNASHAGSFLASSSIPVDSLILSWTPTIDTVYAIGHSLDSGFVYNSGLAPLDKILFQWSSGAYFTPEVAEASAQLMVDSNLWRHPDFEFFRQFSTIPPASFAGLATYASAASKSSYIGGQTIDIFKHNSVTLSSVQDFWKGKLGYQAFPCVANVGTTAVMTASGKVKQDWDSRTATNANEDLPYVKQKHNVTLIMYRHEQRLQLFGFKNPQVALHFTDADFDEIIDNNDWLLGRQDNSYVAVRRNCVDEINTIRACADSTAQTWIMIVGDSMMYGGFQQFQSKINQSQFVTQWSYDSSSSQSVYYSKIVFDTTTIDYAWGVDSSLVSGVNDMEHPSAFSVYPNPANNSLTIDLSEYSNQSISISVTNVLGQQLYHQDMVLNSSAKQVIDVSNWAEGMYWVTIENQTDRFAKKVIVTR